MPRQAIAQLRVGASITKQPYLLRDKSVSTTRTGSLMLRVTLSDRSGALPGVLFDVPSYVVDTLTTGHGVLVTGRVGEFRQQTQINIERIEPTELVHLEEYLPVALRPREEMELELAALCDSVESPLLGSLIKAVFDDQTYAAFVAAPAAKSLHHATVGGLLEHTLAVVRLALESGSGYEDVDQDLLVTAALLHDIGKIDAYDPLTFAITTDGALLGHLYMSAARVERAIAQVEGFDDELRRRLIHAILAHHGRLEHGSPILPMTLEALLVHNADEMDASVRGAWEQMQGTGGQGAFTDESLMHDTRLYRGQDQEPPTQAPLW
ncbi:MAG: HD domain-containing protein [Chloroflexi bacterium]|nr:HD domain-containing protein [Chloroflexota bacterium]